ncbi:MAG: hypothetical protein FWE88_05980 [Phycisphaerae bacterium]|nr:hypothetical protein [Phycisphaerae bacterium]
MKEIGFWDYTCPTHGSLEHYTTDEWDRLLDDMAAGGFNSLVLGIKWLTTGYRSRLPWLDQRADNAAIATDNATIHHALAGARQRGIRPRLLVVSTQFQTPEFGPQFPTIGNWGDVGHYDVDQPGVTERILALFGEVVDLFGQEIDGIVVEMEFCDAEGPHRVASYNRWAAANNRPDFETIKKILLEPRSYPFFDWRDYATQRRIDTLREIEKTVRAGGCNAELSSLVELANGDGVCVSNVNLPVLRDAFPQWPLVTYDSVYDRRVNRLAAMDFCIHQPRKLGLQAYYLTRGVMTWTWPPDATWDTTLQEQWRMSLEDAAAHNPDVLWFMGSDARSDGLVCSNKKLAHWGYHDGIVARRALMEMAKQMGVRVR